MIFLSYLQFLFQSTTHHGVHSPFIFDFIDHCFYNQEWRKKRFIPWNDKQLVKLDRLFKKQIQNYFSKTNPITQNKYDLHFLDWKIKPLPKQPSESSLWVFSNTHTNRSQWHLFSQQAPLRVDFFFWGLVLFKTDQAKESFLLRIL